jgi:hypothetical protein
LNGVSAVGFSVEIPAGALSNTTQVSVIETDAAPPGGLVDFSPVYRFDPPLDLDVAAEFRIGTENAQDVIGSLAVYAASEAGAAFEPLADSIGGTGFMGASSKKVWLLVVGWVPGATLSGCPTITTILPELPGAVCTGAAEEWLGCGGSGCAVCSQSTAFPYYFINHSTCDKGSVCAGSSFKCSGSCPAPTVEDQTYLPGTCEGSVGQWDGCRGNGCTACTDALIGFPKYFENHPRCLANPGCDGLFYTCNDNCPTPTDADK